MDKNSRLCRYFPLLYLPLTQVWFDCLIGCLLNLLVFGGPVAIGAIFSIGAIAQYIAFILPVAIRVIFVRDNFRPGPWNLGKFSRPCGFIALGWVILIVPVLCFPAIAVPAPSLMNWTCLVYGGPMLMALIWYAVDARKWFKGPKVIQCSSLLTGFRSMLNIV
jgi:amino acid transporter